MLNSKFFVCFLVLCFLSCSEREQKEKKENSQLLMRELEGFQLAGDTINYNHKRKEIKQTIASTNDKKLELYFETHDALKLINQGKLDSSVVQLKKIYHKARKQNEKFTMFSALSSLGNVCYFKGNIAGALKFWKIAADIASKSDLQDYLASTYGNIAIGYLELGYYHSASRYFIKAKKQMEKLGIRDENYWTNQVNIANVYLKLNLTEKAIENLKLIDKKDSKKIQYLYYANMASAYSSLNNKEKTILFLDSTRLLLPYNPAYRNFILEEELESYLKFDLNDRLEKTFEIYKSDTSTKSTSLKCTFNSAYYTVNKMYFDPIETISNWQDDIDSTDYETNIAYFSLLSDVYEHKGDYKAQNFALKKLQIYQNKVIDEKLKNQFKDNLLSQKNDKILAENKMLASRNQAKQEQIQKGVILALLTFLLLILLIVIIFLVANNHKKSKEIKDRELRHARSEIFKSQILSKQLTEKLDLQNEKLNSAILLVNKLTILKKQLNDFFDQVSHDKDDSEFNDLIKSAKMDFKSFFSIHNELTVQASSLDEFHEKVKNIQLKHQDLTKKELQVVQLIVNKYSTKEIALLLSRSTKNIEFSRSEIRKKLNIPNEISLSEYLMIS